MLTVHFQRLLLPAHIYHCHTRETYIKTHREVLKVKRVSVISNLIPPALCEVALFLTVMCSE